MEVKTYVLEKRLTESNKMNEKIEAIKEEVANYVIATKENLEAFRIRFLGSKNVVKDLFSDLKTVPNEHKKEVGQRLNALRNEAQERYEAAKSALESSAANDDELDLSRPGDDIRVGARHPLSLVRREIIEVFGRIASALRSIVIETGWHSSVLGVMNPSSTFKL